MRVAVISDIHGNLEAFRQVLLDIDRCRVDATVCLGDCVGYGPEPERCVALLRHRNIPCVMGNHELGLVDSAYLGWFNRPTRHSLLLTRELVSSDTMEFIKGLPASEVLHGCLCVHGCPPDSATTYLFDVPDKKLVQLFQEMRERVCFVGHTHVLEIIGFEGGRVSRALLHRGRISLQGNRQFMINVGSVGQPRDGNNTAKYVVWDDTNRSVEVRFVPYDIAATVRKIREIGLPEMNARRLW
jgi:predicted phosphodiesterase